jgi:hypothetical protein
MAALYHADSFDADKRALGELYSRIGEDIAGDDLSDLEGLYKVMDFKSPIAEILERLE